MSGPNLPSGIVTFLFTDIEGSTTFWEQMPEAMRGSQAQHDAILREAITAHGGLVYKVIGDAFQAAFTVPVQAITAAVAAQIALATAEWPATGPLRVRMGIHLGEAMALESDYETTPVLNQVARIMAAGHGGQVLLSESVAGPAQSVLPSDITLRDMGEHHMRGLIRAIQLYQVVAPGLREQFPPIRTLDYRPANLPVQVTPLIGREREVTEAIRLLSDSRLLSIIGPGGIGKTRLALGVAEELLDELPGGAWFVELASLSDPALVPQAVASAIGLQEQQGRPLVDLLLNYLKQKDSLLILDNCEHLIEACAQFTDTVLRNTSQARILATSRQNLGLTGEQVFGLGGLDLPHRTMAGNGRPPAVRLFLQSARRVVADFDFREGGLVTVARICRLVGGMPLGIILAAAWVDILTLDEIAAEISGSAGFLESELRDLPERQRSMRAAFDYSWRLLAEEERSALARLSVFHGRFDRRAARLVAGATIRVLNRLARKSLLQVDTESHRYSIHELIRHFAQERLEELGESRAVDDAHGRYYLNFLSELEPDLKGRSQGDAFGEIEANFENIRAAWHWAVEQSNAALIDSSLQSLHLFTTYRSHFGEGLELFRVARKSWPADVESPTALAGRLLIRHPDPGQRLDKIFQLGLDIANRKGNRGEIAYALSQLGRYLAHSGSEFDRGLTLMEEGLVLYRELGDDFATATVLDDIAFAHSLSDQVQRIAVAEQSLALRRRIGDQIGVANVLRNLAIATSWMGRYDEANRYVDEALAIARQTGDQINACWMLALLSENNLLKGRLAESEEQFQEAYRIGRELETPDLIRNCLFLRALQMTIVEERFSQARQLLMEARLPSGYQSMLWWGLTVYALVACCLGDYDGAEAEIGRNLQIMVERGISLAGQPYLIPGIALLLFERGRSEASAQCLGYFDSLPRELVAWSDNWSPLARLRSELRSTLGDADYEAALVSGRALDIRSLL